LSLRGDLEALDRAHPAGRQGLEAARRRADRLDEEIDRLFADAGAPGGVAVVAVGGYGRREQLPRSDVDLLILHDPSIDGGDLARSVDPLLYPLWDAGLQVGQAVRTPQGCTAIARTHLDALTSMLDRRWLAGDRALVEEMTHGVRAFVGEDPAAFVGRLRAAAAERRTRFGAVGHRIEPELKEGEGGLRDVASLRWLAAAVGPLEEAGALRGPERAAVAEAAEFLTRVRSAVHLETGTRTDRLRRDLQPALAEAMGFVVGPGLAAEDALMRTVFDHGRQVAHVVRAAFARCASEPGGDDGSVSIPRGDAAAVLRALADRAASGAVPAPALLDAIEAAGVDDPVVWTEAVRAAFLRLIAAGDAGVEGLEILDRLGLLTRYLPAWSGVRARPQRDPYHRYAVDRHLTAALREVDRMLADAGEDGDDLERDAVRRVTDPDAVRLGTLLHDVGKIGEGGHVDIGARIAADTLGEMGLPAPTRELASFMVAQHLLLPDTATRRDLTAEDLVLDVASRVGSPERLAALYLLAKADAIATGSSAWTPWRQALLRELVLKVQRAFERGDVGEALAERLAERTGRVRSLLPGAADDALDRFVLTMPRGYFLAIEPERVAAHYPVIAPPIGPDEVRVAAVPGARANTYELLVVAPDRPGLLSWIAGSLALGALSILTAQIFTTAEGTAVDVFEVEGAFEPEVPDGRWQEIRSTLAAAIEGRIALDRRVADKRARYPSAEGVPVSVTVDNEASDFSTVIEVGAPDRIGLLHDITAALADLQLDVRVAKVATYADRVIDVFYVRDALGAKVTDPAQFAEIEATVQGRVNGATSVRAPFAR
jgi:[protein-PII] uridylyltransferase